MNHAHLPLPTVSVLKVSVLKVSALKVSALKVSVLKVSLLTALVLMACGGALEDEAPSTSTAQGGASQVSSDRDAGAVGVGGAVTVDGGGPPVAAGGAIVIGTTSVAAGGAAMKGQHYQCSVSQGQSSGCAYDGLGVPNVVYDAAFNSCTALPFVPCDAQPYETVAGCQAGCLGLTSRGYCPLQVPVAGASCEDPSSLCIYDVNGACLCRDWTCSETIICSPFFLTSPPSGSCSGRVCVVEALQVMASANVASCPAGSWELEVLLY